MEENIYNLQLALSSIIDKDVENKLMVEVSIILNVIKELENDK